MTIPVARTTISIVHGGKFHRECYGDTVPRVACALWVLRDPSAGIDIVSKRYSLEDCAVALPMYVSLN